MTSAAADVSLGPGRHAFRGFIAGTGSTSGTRVVVGHWTDSPLGRFSDAMVETADGWRVLLAPTASVARFVASTYTFDEVRVEPFSVCVVPHRWAVRSDSLHLDLDVGGRTPLGRALRLQPARLAASPAWTRVTDPVARLAVRGVRTRGTAGHDRTETYGARDVHRVVEATGSVDGVDLGSVAPVDPPCRFGFSSTPPQPSVTAVVSTVIVRPPS